MPNIYEQIGYNILLKYRKDLKHQSKLGTSSVQYDLDTDRLFDQLFLKQRVE